MARLAGWQRLVGRWTSEGAHPEVPGEVIGGEATFEWLDDQQCLVQRILYDHADVADALTVTAVVGGVPTMHHFDSSGLHLEYEVEITESAWRFWNADLRWLGEFAEGGAEIRCRLERYAGGETWVTEFETTYRRDPGRGPR